MDNSEMTHDPFAFEDDDKTVFRPGNFHASAAPPRKAAVREQTHTAPLLGGINPLEHAASHLIPLLITIRASQSHPAPNQLRNQLILELDNFKVRARDILDDPKQVTQASYVMCTVLDEATMNTPWGHTSNWSQHNLLSTFHNEVAGGERFFALLKGLGKSPQKNIQLLELMYVCLSLGYEGSYRLAANGQETLIRVRNWLHELIQSVRDVPENALSKRWQGSSIKEKKLPRLTPLWVGFAAALAIASLSYVSLLFSLGSYSEIVITGFMDAQPKTLSIHTVAPPPKPLIRASTISAIAPLTLSEYLEPEISRGHLVVLESFDHGTVRLLGDNLFSSGSATVNANAQALIEYAGTVLNNYNGAVVVTGYSDNLPIRSARFPSNLALSRARAESVTGILTKTIQNRDRITAEGRGSLDPIGDNSTAGGRSKNRRVEITVYY